MNYLIKNIYIIAFAYGIRRSLSLGIPDYAVKEWLDALEFINKYRTY